MGGMITATAFGVFFVPVFFVVVRSWMISRSRRRTAAAEVQHG